jgi:hypothetical protein
MGASSWYYIVPYQPDLQAALTELQSKVFREDDYIWYDDDERPSTISELWHSEWMMSGTHSILDVDRILGDENLPLGAIRPCTAEERRQFFGTETPTRADFDHALDDIEFVAEPERWTGRCVVLLRDGTPHEIAFWGNSGD